MTNADLASLLNSELGLTGTAAVTPNVIRQWVGWGVLPHSTAKGRSVGESPEWSRSGKARRRALRLAALRKAGVVRENAVVAQAFFEWGHPNFELVKQALLAELRKWRSQLLRRRTTRLSGVDYQSLGAAQQRAISNQLGALDRRFVGNQFEQSPELFAVIAESTELDEVAPHRVDQLVTAAFDKMMPGVVKSLPASCTNLFLTSLPGLLGSPEEIANSAETKVRDCSERNLRIARVMRLRMLAALSRTNHSSLSRSSNLVELMNMNKNLLPQISVGPWAVFHFMQCLAAVEANAYPTN